MALKCNVFHGVSEGEIQETYSPYNGIVLEDYRMQHRFNPATEWFISRTNAGRLLKIIFVPRVDVGYPCLRSAYDAKPKGDSHFHE